MKPLSVRSAVLLFGIAFQISAAPDYRILSECDPSATVRASLAKEAQVDVHFAIAGASTCYSVTATVDGKQVRGYVIGTDLDAVLAFEKARIQATRDGINASPVIPQPDPQPAAPSVKATDADKPAEAKPAEAAKPVQDAPKRKEPLAPLR
jgi:hypothetical protein